MFEHADGDPILKLDDEQSWKLIDSTKHGRLVVTVAGEPDIFPVNYVTSGRKLFLRTAPGNKLAELTINSKVLFETDGILSEEAWSVVLRGTARVLDQSADIADAVLIVDSAAITHLSIRIEYERDRSAQSSERIGEPIGGVF